MNASFGSKMRNTMKRLLVVLSLVIFQYAASQPIIHGNISEMGSIHPIQDVLVTVFMDDDSLVTTTTNSSGEFSFDSLVLIPERTYVVTASAPCYNLTPLFLSLSKGTSVTLSEIKWSGMRLMDCPNRMLSFRFEPFSAELNESFELESLKELLTDYESLELTLMLFQIPNESIELGQKRIQVFRKLLIDQTIDLTRVTIDSEIHWISLDALHETYSLPQFQGIITKN